MSKKHESFRIQKGDPCRLGAIRTGTGCNFTIALGNFNKAYLVLLSDAKSAAPVHIELEPSFRYGNLISVYIEGLPDTTIAYYYLVDGKKVVDQAARAVKGRERFGFSEERRENILGLLPGTEYKESDIPGIFISYVDAIFYKVHVRGYTMQNSTKVKAKGTFLGLTEKISYFKELGITSLLLMPAYDFIEKTESQEHYNYWGYTGGYYYTPKAAYCKGSDSIKEFQYFVDCFHKENLEIIMEFYFPESMNPMNAVDILRYWALFYHVDGFRLLGSRQCMEMAARDDLLRKVKIIGTGFSLDDERQNFPNTAFCNQDFMMNARRLLKGDDNQIAGFVWHNRYNPSTHAVINYMTDHDGFTLNDLVSYSERHNEENGEMNRDGSLDNASWNCGFEGKTRRNAILQLRTRQIKNAILMLLLSQGAPMIYGGDEICNSQNGNNNAWCQDNSTGWVNWKRSVKGEEIHSFVKEIIAFRKMHRILHLDREIRDTDYRSFGSPELSYHSDRAWFSAMDSASRSIGMMYCGEYAADDNGEADDYIYVAYNMHWLEKEFAIPLLPEGKSWYIVVDTSAKGNSVFLNEEQKVHELKKLKVPPRTIIVLTGK